MMCLVKYLYWELWGRMLSCDKCPCCRRGKDVEE